MNAKIYYQDDRFLISSRTARAPLKTYRISRIEKVSVRRDPFYIALALVFLVVLFLLAFDAMPPAGNLLMILTVSCMAYAASKIGVLMVTTKAFSEIAFFGSYDTIKKVRAALDKAMHDHDAGDRGIGAPGSNDDGEE